MFSNLFKKKKKEPTAVSYDLNRFIEAQERIYPKVIQELANGYKYHHWMWYIFPQYHGLAYSNQSKNYAIKSIEEAKAYLAHPILGQRLTECCNLLLAIENRDISSILGYPDNLKLNSSMTLFWSVSKDELFQKVLERYFDGKWDKRTVDLLNNRK